MNKAIPLFFGLGILVGLVLVVLGVFVWPMAAAQVQAAGAAQQPYAGCPRHGGGMMTAASPSRGEPGGCPMLAGEGIANCPVHGEAGTCPQHDGANCPMHGEGGVVDCPQYIDAGDCPVHAGAGDCPLQSGVGECPMQSGAGDCPMWELTGTSGCPMESGIVK